MGHMAFDGGQSARPLIGITGYLEPARWSDFIREAVISPVTYSRSVERARGIPVVLPPVPIDSVPRLVAGLDGILISCGPDIDPRLYLYAEAPDLAPRLDCIISGESGWDPSQVNGRTRAAGLAQFLPSTWATTPQGEQGLSPFEPQANIDAAIWLARTRGWQEWQVFVQGRCR